MPDSKEKWNTKYSSKSSFSTEPDQFLVDQVALLKEGSVLDFACGTGRNSIWLAKMGFEVTGADISDIGLLRLKVSAKESHVVIRTLEVDLTNELKLENLGPCDNIIINMYKPSQEILLMLPKLLNEGGVLLICTHNWKQVEAGKFKKEFCLMPNELIDIKWEMKLVKHSTFELDSGFYDGYVFSK
ncbi:MAG: class I SAM-dependent methyltransferase [Reichenbachiella sp.]|uniref:class I SAM-dependent methyltransferase n=1 Tax=Reichenbachiella sp. TaxID=2184521 RepID=UPI003265BDC9